MPWLILISLAFVCGSVPFGLLIARARGIDIRKHGSGNIGATNVWRVMGRGPGLLCFVLDVLKGLVPVLIAGWWMGLLGGHQIAPRQAWLWLAVMAAPILGHMFTPFAGFKGGKGVATGLGAMLGLYPYLTFPALGVFAVWIAAAAVWRYVSLASCVAALSLPALVFAFAGKLSWIGVGLAAGAGATLGELSGYLAGFSGQAIVENQALYDRFEGYMKKYGGLTITVLAFLPLPVFDLAGVAAGALRMNVLKFLSWCFLGKLPKMLIIAYAGAYSIGWITQFFK